MRSLLLAGALLAVAASAATAALSPGQTYASSILAARAQHAVHYVSQSRLAGNDETIVGDAARDRGIQRITFTKAGTTGHVTVVVLANIAYVRGDAFALEEYMGLTAAQAKTFNGRWFLLKPPSGAYRVVAEAVRFDSLLAELAMPAPYRPAPAKTIAGKAVQGIRSSVTRSGVTVSVTLYARASALPLPVQQVAQGSRGVITTTLGSWNERVAVAKPQGAVPFH